MACCMVRFCMSGLNACIYWYKQVDYDRNVCIYRVTKHLYCAGVSSLTPVKASREEMSGLTVAKAPRIANRHNPPRIDRNHVYYSNVSRLLAVLWQMEHSRRARCLVRGRGRSYPTNPLPSSSDWNVSA